MVTGWPGGETLGLEEASTDGSPGEKETPAGAQRISGMEEVQPGPGEGTETWRLLELAGEGD